MTVKMIATRTYYDPALRKEYRPGAEFGVASEADADKLERRKKAKRANLRPSIVDLPAKAMQPVEVVEEPVPLSRSYLRRDMVAEDSQTGEDSQLPSLRRGRPRKVQTSEASGDDSE